MKILWTGGPAWGARGTLMVSEGKGEDEVFRAVGPGEIVEVGDERGRLLISKGLASLDLQAADDFEPMDPRELQAASDDYNAVHREVLKSLKERKAALARVEAAAGGRA